MICSLLSRLLQQKTTRNCNILAIIPTFVYKNGWACAQPMTVREPTTLLQHCTVPNLYIYNL